MGNGWNIFHWSPSLDLGTLAVGQHTLRFALESGDNLGFEFDLALLSSPGLCTPIPEPSPTWPPSPTPTYTPTVEPTPSPTATPGSYEYISVIDHHDTPLEWYYNRSGGDRGLMMDTGTECDWCCTGDTCYTATMQSYPSSWGWLGMWYCVARNGAQNCDMDPEAVFGTHIAEEYQAHLTGVSVLVNDVSGDNATFKIELKDSADNPVWQQEWTGIGTLTYPHTFYAPIDPGCILPFEMVTWVFDHADEGDYITADAVKLHLTFDNPLHIDKTDEYFLWSYNWLLRNLDETSGMVQDRANFPDGDMENISATAKTAKLTAYASIMGITETSDAEAIVAQIANVMLDSVPRHDLSGLWPHFTRDGGTVILEDSEWSTLDTAIAALDLAVALQLMGDPEDRLPDLYAFLADIDWQSLLIPLSSPTTANGVSYGYTYEDELINATCIGFGMETIAINWAMCPFTGERSFMQDPPTDNGSGFIMHSRFPQIPAVFDAWLNDWPSLRSQEADRQIAWYCLTDSPNSLFCDEGLFGLSAAEVPAPWNGGDLYQAYGIGGRCSGPNDGNHDMLVAHYAAMISDIRRTEAIAVWNRLVSHELLSPLNNLESLRAPVAVGKITEMNPLKGSWNIALEAEGWAMSDPAIRAAVDEAIEQVDFLVEGRDGVSRGTVTVNLKLHCDHYRSCLEWLLPGDHFELWAMAGNPRQEALIDAFMAVILDVYGAYFFYPSWTEAFDGALLNLDPYEVSAAPENTPFLQFTWPDTGPDSLNGLYFWAGVLNKELNDLMGEIEVLEFGYGPVGE
ncbi:hypothetical protein JW905_16960 [bacterium]|nr:hypothetical protein [candidate division CSSED10-310 bacterium]